MLYWHVSLLNGICKQCFMYTDGYHHTRLPPWNFRWGLHMFNTTRRCSSETILKRKQKSVLMNDMVSHTSLLIIHVNKLFAWDHGW